MKQMKKITSLTSLVTFLACVFVCVSAYAVSPAGYWKTIDDVTGKPKSILKIMQSGNGNLYGQIVRIFPRPGYDQNEVCSACTGENHNRRIVGLIIMRGLKQNTDDPSQWTGGDILDPSNGKTYHCNLQIIENGQRLRVRGYVGVPLFGRTQTWLRVGSSQG